MDDLTSLTTFTTTSLQSTLFGSSSAATTTAVPENVGTAFSRVMFVLKLLQLLVGFCGNAFSLTVLLLYRHYLAHPFWFYLVALCTVDLFGCLLFLIDMEEPAGLYHELLYKNNHVNVQLETWVLNMVRDLSAWLIVFIAIERWKSVCWHSVASSPMSLLNNNHSSCSQQRHRLLPSPVMTSHPAGGFASFKRRTAQLETFFIVTGALMIINATNYFANENLWGTNHDIGDIDVAGNGTNSTMALNGTYLLLNSTDVLSTAVTSSTANISSPAYQAPKTLSTESYLAEQWSKAWLYLKELKQCWLPALVLLVLNLWIIVHTVRFLYNSRHPHPPFGHRLNTFRRLTSSSISTQTPNTANTATTTPGTTAGSMSPLAVNANNITAAVTPASIAYHRSQSRRRRRLVVAWLTLLALPTIFIALTLPLSLFNVMDNFAKITSESEFRIYLVRDSLVHWLSDCNHTVNCFIYCLTIAKFRQAIARIFESFIGRFRKCIAILRKKPTDSDLENGEQQCQLVTFLDRARQLHRFHAAKKRRFVVGVLENVEAISSFQHHRAAAQLGIRRASGMESGIAFEVKS